MAYQIPDRVSSDILEPLLKKLNKRGDDAQLKRELAIHYGVEIADAMGQLRPKHCHKI